MIQTNTVGEISHAGEIVLLNLLRRVDGLRGVRQVFRDRRDPSDDILLQLSTPSSQVAVRINY